MNGPEAGRQETAHRIVELETNLNELSARIHAACAAAGRSPGSVRLLPVTKFFPATDITLLHRLGRREFGEARPQEAVEKVDASSDLADITWHLIGRLQRNKARQVARWADVVHSVDSVRLATTLDTATTTALDVHERRDPMRVLIQVSLDADPNRGGVRPDALAELADYVAGSKSLQLSGLMAIPPVHTDPDAAFTRLAELHNRLLTAHPRASELSAGMSNDLEHAVAHGSTCVRVGTASMGARPITSR